MANAGVMLFKGPHARRTTPIAGYIEGRRNKRQFVATARVMLFKGPQARRWAQKAVHRPGGTHNRRPVATVGVKLFQGPETTFWVFCLVPAPPRVCPAFCVDPFCLEPVK